MRELRNVIERAALVHGADGTITADKLSLDRSQQYSMPLLPSRPARALTPEEALRKDRLIALFAVHRGNISEVARQLGKQRVQIRRWIKLYGIDLHDVKRSQ